MSTLRQLRHLFYKRLREQIVGQPSRASSTRGVCWPANVKQDRSSPRCTYHAIFVQAYAGSESGATWPYRAIPRIYLNYFDVGGPNHSDVQKWTGSRRLSAAARSSLQFKLTTTLDELVEFAPWVVAWVDAHDLSEPSRLPAPPHPLEIAPAEAYLADSVWTKAANVQLALQPKGAAA